MCAAVAKASNTPTPKRLNSEMEPDSPVSSNSMRSILQEFVDPIKEEICQIKQFMNSTNIKLQQIVEIQQKVSDIEGACQGLSHKVDSLDSIHKSHAEKIHELEVHSQEQLHKIDALESKNRAFHDELLHAEYQSRRNNLQFKGIPENVQENCEYIVIRLCQTAQIDLRPFSFVRAHRLGRYDRTRIIPIIVKFQHFKERELVWNNRKRIQSISDVRVLEDFPLEIENRRKALFPILNAAYNYKDPQYPGDKFRAKIVNLDKLLVNGALYTVDSLHKLPEPLRPETIATPTLNDTVVFFTKSSPLSNHYQCSFTVDGTNYNCMEQYLMKCKALTFNDTAIAAKVMQTTDPVTQKSLGKQIVNFDKKIWQKSVPDILLEGLRAKFSQNEHCRAFLKKTDNKVIGEANPYDLFFGIGKGLHDNDVWNISKWANNLLGKSLMTIRQGLD